MFTKTSEVVWLSGLLDGTGSIGILKEGCSGLYLSLAMSDYEPLRKAHLIFEPIYNKTGWGAIYSAPNRKQDIHRFFITGGLALQWMFLLYELVGTRRKSEIETAVNKYLQFPIRKRGRPRKESL